MELRDTQQDDRIPNAIPLIVIPPAVVIVKIKSCNLENERSLTRQPFLIDSRKVPQSDNKAANYSFVGHGFL